MSAAICSGCGWSIDPETCHCGEAINQHHAGSGHSPVPAGCTCGYADAEKRKASDYERLENILRGIRAERLTLKGGTKLTPEGAVEALDAAMTIIEAVGTTGIYSRMGAAAVWMKKYYPNWA